MAYAIGPHVSAFDRLIYSVHNAELRWGYSRIYLIQNVLKRIRTLLWEHAFFILLTHEGSHREVYQEFQPSYDIFRRWCQGLFRTQVPDEHSVENITHWISNGSEKRALKR